MKKYLLLSLFMLVLTYGKHKTTPVVNGKNMIDVSTIYSWNFSSRPSGWYRIATRTGGYRPNATFELREEASHSTLRFEVGISFNYSLGSSVTITNHSIYAASIFRKIRVLSNTTYDDVFLEVYVDLHGNNNNTFNAWMLNPLSAGDWELTNWTTGSVPSGYFTAEFDVDQLFTVGNGENSNILSVTRNGRVGIGTTTPSDMLSVNGKIRAKEIKVETTGWPDFVFQPGYNLLSLPATAAYIKTNGHLPGMPAAREAEANGIELGEMNKKLLQKVEELTLHLIEKDKQLTAEQLTNKTQEKRLATLEKTILQVLAERTNQNPENGSRPKR